MDTQRKIAHRTPHAVLPPGGCCVGGQLAPAGAAAGSSAPPPGATRWAMVGGNAGLVISSNTVTVAPGPVPPPPPPPRGRDFPNLVDLSTGGQTSAPPPATLPARTSSARPEIQREELGEQMIEGVLAKGTRITQTWPTGANGSDRPYQSVNESWYSATIKAMVLMTVVDPRSGGYSTKLIHIETSEPPLSLFQPPADYNVVDETAAFEIQWTGTAKAGPLTVR